MISLNFSAFPRWRLLKPLILLDFPRWLAGWLAGWLVGWLVGAGNPAYKEWQKIIYAIC